MIVKRLCVVIALFCVVLSYAQQRAQTIVFIDGQRYYIHTVEAGETIYSLAKLYEVTEGDILDSNPNTKKSGLKSNDNIKIPINSEAKGGEKVEIDKKKRKNFHIHTVSQGQTLYSIAQQYSISVSVIVADNPDIDPSSLSLGQDIFIRKQKIGQGSSDEAIEALSRYTSTMNRVAPQGYEYYVVTPQETLYSLLRRTEMTQQEFEEINPNSGNTLRAGEIILVRNGEQIPVEEERVITPYRRLSAEEIRFKSLGANDTLSVSLLLPLSSPSGAVVPLFREFYQGFLLGIQELKGSGRSVEINLYDTQRDSMVVRKIAESPEFKESDLIVGPVYEELLKEIVPVAERYMIPVVSPLATLKDSSSGVVFQMAPVPDRRYDKIEDLVADSVRLTLIYSEHTDAGYESQVKRLIGEREYNLHAYEYEHPSVIAERVREAIREEREEELEPSPSDLSPLILGDTLTTIFIMSDNETDVDRILSALASAKISLKSRSLEVCDFRVVGNPQWNRYPNIDRAMLFSAHLTAFSSYHAKRDSDVVKSFDGRYVDSFGALPSLYSYRGYDVAKIFGQGLYSDIEHGMEGRTFTPLQSSYQFERVVQGSGRANTNWIRVNYMPNFTITLE